MPVSLHAPVSVLQKSPAAQSPLTVQVGGVGVGVTAVGIGVSVAGVGVAVV
jgi:hypothetical protein